MLAAAALIGLAATHAIHQASAADGRHHPLAGNVTEGGYVMSAKMGR